MVLLATYHISNIIDSIIVRLLDLFANFKYVENEDGWKILQQKW